MSLRPSDKKAGVFGERQGLIPVQQATEQDKHFIELHEKLEGRGNPLEEGLREKAPFTKDQIVVINGKPAWYIHDRFKRETIPNNNSKPFIAQNEYGILLFFEAHFDRQQDGIRVELEGRNKGKIVLVDHLANQMVQLARGLSPGSVKTLPDGTSPDPMGTPDDFVPWVAKYKVTTEADGIGNTGKGVVIRYTPRHPIEYKSIRMTWLNISGSNSLLLSAEIIRAQFLDQNELLAYGFNRL